MAEKELELLESVELRFALAETDVQFQQLLGTLLAPVLAKLDSPNAGTRNKVMSLLAHLNKRLKSSESVQLPVVALMALFTDGKVSNMVRNFALVYLEMAFKRVHAEGANFHVASLVKGISKRPAPQQQTLFHILVPLLPKYTSLFSMTDLTAAQPPISDDPLGFQQDPADGQYLLDKFANVVLYTPPLPPPTQRGPPTQQQVNAQRQGADAATVPPEVHQPPGMSRSAVTFVTNGGKASWAASHASLRDVKLSILRFLGSTHIFGQPGPSNTGAPLMWHRFRIHMIASVDGHHEVQTKGEDGIKRLGRPDLEDPVCVAGLFALYQGTMDKKVKDEDRRLPAGNALKQRVLGYMSKSVKATNVFPGVVQVVFDALYGDSTNAKLRRDGMSFMQWVARMADATTLRPVGPILLSGLLKFIAESRAEEEDGIAKGPDAEGLRGFAYEALGFLARRLPDLFSSDLGILSSFFTALHTEPTNVRVSLQTALSSMLDAYTSVVKDAPADSPAVIEILDLLLENVIRPEHQARFTAVRYAIALFPFSHPVARYVCLLASGDAKLEVRELARQGLKFPEPTGTGSGEARVKSIPLFGEVVRVVQERATWLRGKASTAISASRTDPTRLSPLAGKTIVGFTLDAYGVLLEFLRALIVVNADPANARVSEVGSWAMHGVEEGDIGRILDEGTREKVRGWISKEWSGTGQGDLQGYLHLVNECLSSSDADATLQVVASSCLLEITSLGPIGLAAEYDGPKIEWLQSFLQSNKLETRVSVADVLGIVVAGSGSSKEENLTSTLTLTIKFLNVARDAKIQEHRHGAIVAIGFILSRLIMRHGKLLDSLSSEVLIPTLGIILTDLKTPSGVGLPVHGALTAVAELGRCQSLRELVSTLGVGVQASNGSSSAMEIDSPPATDGKQEKPKSEIPNKTQSGTNNVIVDEIINIVKKGRDAKMQELAIATLGNLGLGDTSLGSPLADVYYGLATSLSKQVEMQFTVGESFSVIVGGWESAVARRELDVSGVAPVETEETRNTRRLLLEAALSKFKEMLTKGPAVRKAVCIWYLCLVKHLGHSDEIKSRLPAIHVALSSLLSDRDDFTQEVASRALSLIYDLGDDALRKELVSSLMGTLLEGKKLQAGSITADTPILEGVGSTPSGENISTYQSILSLAADMNQPDLVYRFMNLASQNAIWNSRRGASIGMTRIIAAAEQELQPYLPMLIPKLYRWRFDPNPKVSDAMNSIWKAVVKDAAKSIEDYFDTIMKDLLEGMGNRLWRTRESSCIALSDLVTGRQLEQLEKYMTQLWTMCFRCLDDIKDSVRNAALTTCRTLATATIKYCDPTVASVTEGQKIMDIVMPFMLNKGLTNMAEDVKKFSLQTVLKLVKKGGVLLKPHIADTVTSCLQSLSTLEPQALNYLTFHAEKYNLTQEQIDTTRLRAAKSSPLMDAVETCIDQVDPQVLEVLVPKLNNVIRRGVGLPTKAGSARFVVSLTVRVPEPLKTHADSILRALIAALNDRNPSVQKSLAVAIGYIAKLCPPDNARKLIEQMRNSYFESEETDKSIPAVVVHEISKHSSDLFKSHLLDTSLPLVFYGMHDSDKTVSEIWKEVWEENTAGSSSTLRLYLDELTTLVVPLLTSQSWGLKRQAGATIAELSKILGPILNSKAPVLIPSLTESLYGRTWEGKEALLEALSKCGIASNDYFREKGNEKKLEEVATVLLREAKKQQNKQYRQHALAALGAFLDAFDDLDFIGSVYDVLLDAAQNPNKDKDDAEEGEKGKAKALADLVQSNAYRGMAQAFPKKETESQAEFGDKIATTFATCLSSPTTTWTVRLAVLEGLTTLLDKMDLTKANPPLSVESSIAVVGGLLQCLENLKFSTVRESGIRVTKIFFEKIKDTSLGRNEAIITKLGDGIARAASKEGLLNIRTVELELAAVVQQHTKGAK